MLGIYSDFFEVIDKEREYKKYLTFHIGHVEDGFYKFIEPLKGKYAKDVDDAVDLCGQQVTLHDLSKLSRFEFDAYRRHFYPTEREKSLKKEIDREFEGAVEHHYKNNPHHPVYWTGYGEKKDMPLNYIFEMLCDWWAVSQWYDSSLTEWYKKAEKEKKAMTEKTREMVDYWFKEIFNGL